MVVIGLAIALLPGPLLLYGPVHRVLEWICVRHARRFCIRLGLQPNRMRWRPDFDKSGLKTEFTFIQLDCFDHRGARRLVTLLVWPLGVWKQVGNEAFTEPAADSLPAA